MNTASNFSKEREVLADITLSRYQASIRFMLSTVLLAFVLMGCSPPSQPTIVIRAGAPTGDTFYVPPQPIWSFGVTNTGTSIACWMAEVEVQGGGDQEYSHAGGHIEWPEGVLAPGQGITTNMIVPAKTGSVWRARLEFWAVSPQELKKAQDTANRLGKSVVGFCPSSIGGRRTFNDEWHH